MPNFRVVTGSLLSRATLRPPWSRNRRAMLPRPGTRIRTTLRRLGYGDELTPASNAHILERGRTKSNLKKLETEAGLRLPRAVSTRMRRCAALFAFVIILAAVFSLQPRPTAAFIGTIAGLILAGAILNYGDPGKSPLTCDTLADLTRKAAGMITVASSGWVPGTGIRISGKIWWRRYRVMPCRSRRSRERPSFYKANLRNGQRCKNLAGFGRVSDPAVGPPRRPWTANSHNAGSHMRDLKPAKQPAQQGCINGFGQHRHTGFSCCFNQQRIDIRRNKHTQGWRIAVAPSDFFNQR